MLGNIAELNTMIDATLQFARDEAKAEAWRRTDVTALLAAIVDDMQDAGLAVEMAPAASEVWSASQAACAACWAICSTMR